MYLQTNGTDKLELIKLEQLKIQSRVLENFPTFLDDIGNIIILPTLWLLHLNNLGVVTRFNLESSRRNKTTFEGLGQERQVWSLKENPVADQTIKSYIWKVFNFFQYINTLSNSNAIKTLSVHNSELVTSNFLDHYLNEILPSRTNSVASLELNRSAIMAYFDFLTYMEIIPRLNSSIYRKTRNQVNNNDHRPLKIKYISRDQRSALLMNCSSLRDRLILRVGYEVGLRAEECTGLRLQATEAKGQIFPGINSLIDEFDSNLQQRQFIYLLSGKYTKRGKSRYIYFDRELMSSIKEYRDIERCRYKSNLEPTDSLFLRHDNSGGGREIGGHHASKVFAKLRKYVKNLNPISSYHDLRHTFATELYHQEQYDESGYETRSESTALIKVQQRLGHASTDSTLIYVHLRQYLIRLEGE